MKARRAVCTALCLVAGCLPESDDLGAYAAGWSPARGGSGGAGVAGGGGAESVMSPASEPTPDASDGVVGGGMLAPAGGGTSAPAGSSGSGAGGASASAAEPSGTGGTSGVVVMPPEACADGVLGQDGSRCYLVSTDLAAWQTAREECAAWRGDLIQVETAEEDALVASLVSASLWLGASDVIVDNLFAWVDGTPVDYGNWGPAQPDRFPGPDCVEKRDTLGRLWFDQPCENERAFICEKVVPAP